MDKGISMVGLSDYLDSNEMIAEYLNALLIEGDNAELIAAINHFAD